MNYIDLMPSEVKLHLDKYNTKIITDEEEVEDALRKRDMSDYDSIIVKQKDKNNKISQIIIYVGSDENVIHEIGHVIDVKDGVDYYWSSSEMFNSIFDEEAAKSDYTEYEKSSSKEYFAESMIDYFLNGIAMSSKRPKTYKFIRYVISQI